MISESDKKKILNNLNVMRIKSLRWFFNEDYGDVLRLSHGDLEPDNPYDQDLVKRLAGYIAGEIKREQLIEPREPSEDEIAIATPSDLDQLSVPHPRERDAWDEGERDIAYITFQMDDERIEVLDFIECRVWYIPRSIYDLQ